MRRKNAAEWNAPAPRLDATFAALFGLLVTAFMMSGDERLSSKLASTAATGIGLTLAVSFAFEARSGLKNLVRADLMGIVALYYLTLYEFLFPQPYFDRNMPHAPTVYAALWAVMLGFAGIFIGRHLLPKGKQPFASVMQRPVPQNVLILVFWGSFFAGYLHMLLAVDFNIPKMVDYMTRARFEQPWGRGRYGDWKALLNELALLLYFIPPLTGLMLARRERYSPIQLTLVLCGFAWTLFYGFVGGTRSQFGAFLVTFMIAMAFASPTERRKQVLTAFLGCTLAMLLSTNAMLQMRTVGFQNWWAGKYRVVVNRQSTSVFVDDNLLAISKIVGFFPQQHPYLGLEIPYLAVVRPIPRVLWPGKPTGLSVSLESDIFGMSGLTISSTCVGEGFMSGGYFGVFLQSLILGLLAGYWNRLASPKNSELGILIYASGFFAVVITMRSTFALTTALLTPLAGGVAGKLLLKGVRKIMPTRQPVVPPALREKKPPTQ